MKVLTLLSTGVKVSDALLLLLQDTEKAMTIGFVDIGKEGTKLRIFLDLIAVLWDTPPINMKLDVLGHNSLACCHVFNFRRRSASDYHSKFAYVSLFHLQSAMESDYIIQ